MPRYAIGILLLTGLSACSLGTDCDDQVTISKASPDGRHIARLFVRNCGATSGYVTQLAIGDRSAPLSRSTVVFIADDSHGEALTDGPAIWTDMHWNSSTELFLAYAERATVFKKLDRAGSARIRYRATSPMTLPPVF